MACVVGLDKVRVGQFEARGAVCVVHVSVSHSSLLKCCCCRTWDTSTVVVVPVDTRHFDCVLGRWNLELWRRFGRDEKVVRHGWISSAVNE